MEGRDERVHAEDFGAAAKSKDAHARARWVLGRLGRIGRIGRLRSLRSLRSLGRRDGAEAAEYVGGERGRRRLGHKRDLRLIARGASNTFFGKGWNHPKKRGLLRFCVFAFLRFRGQTTLIYLNQKGRQNGVELSEKRMGASANQANAPIAEARAPRAMFQRTDATPIRATRCQFDVAAPTRVPRTLMAGEYPPTGSRANAPHANPTSAAIAKHIGVGRHDWIDIVPYAPVETPSGEIDRRALRASVLADRRAQSEWIERIGGWVDACGQAGMVMPVVYIAGGLCNEVWAAACNERFTLSSTVSRCLGVHVFATATTSCLVMADQPHPSWALVSHGDPIAVAAFRRAMRALDVLLVDEHGRAACDEARLLAMLDDAERVRLERRATFMEKIGLCDGRWPAELRHFRDAPYDKGEFMEQLDELLRYGLSQKQLRSVMARSLFNRPLARATREALKAWHAALGPRGFVTFMRGGVASALASDGAGAFEARLQRWLAALGARGFVTFMCDGVASALASDGADGITPSCFYRK